MIPRIAKKDIVVYKWLTKRYDKLYTPIYDSEVEIGKTYKGIFSSDIDGIPECFISSLFRHWIGSGYIHSYSKPKDKEYLKSNDVSVKCIIPKGTLYFIGDSGDIASRKLKYVEIIE